MPWAIKPHALLVALLSLLTGAALAHTSPRAALPEWAQAAAARPQKTYPPRTNAVVLLDEHTVSVSKPGEYVESVRRVVRILRSEGTNEASLSIPTSADDKLLSAHGWCASPDGHQYEVEEKNFVKRSDWGGDTLYDDVAFQQATVPGGNPGAVVAFEYSEQLRAWGDYTDWDVQEKIPVEEAHFKLSLPAGWNYQASWVNAPAIAPVAGGSSQWSWTLHDIAPIDVEEKHRPEFIALAARMQLAFSPPGSTVPVFASWSSIGKWAEDLAQPRRQPTPELTAKVQQLTAGAAGFDETTARLADFMQREIRYVGIEIGIGGFQPHAAGDVFRNRYGDCKDKATLLATMLQVAGIRSRNVLIFDKHGVTQKDSPGNFFNHAILAIELPASSKAVYHSVVTSKSGQRYLIFDPTNEYVPLGELPEYEQGNYVLLTGAEGGELIQLPVFEPQQNHRALTGKLTVDQDGAVSGELLIHRTGAHAWRERAHFRHASELERTKHAENLLASSLQSVSLKEAKVENLDQIGKEFTERYTFTAPGFLKATGPLLTFQPCLFGREGIRLDWKKRKYPVDLGSTSEKMDSYEIVLPANLEIEELPDPVQIDVGFASYKSSITASNGVVHYQREFVVRDPQVPVTKLDELRKLEEAITRDESGSVVLKKI